MAAVIRVTRVIIRSGGEEREETLIPVARIDEVTPIDHPEGVTFAWSQIRKVNGEFLYVAEKLDVVESLIAHAGRN